MEKKVGIVKGICLFMALLCTVIVGWFVYRAGEGRYKTYKVTAAEMLKEALVQEMDTRPAIESYIGRIGETRPWESLPDTIVPRWKSAEGTFPFGFPSSELRNNIAGEEKGIDGGICALHSIKLLENPMNADSLYQRWLHLLPFSQHPTLGLRMNYTDLYGKQTVSSVPEDANRLAQLDSLCTWNVGNRCELKVTAYGALPGWWQWLAWWEWMFVIVPLACLALLYGFRKPLYRIGERLLVREKVVEKVKEVEKVVYVKSTGSNQDVKTYEIGKHVYFNVLSGKLWNNEQETVLSPQSAALLQTFLEAEDYKVKKQYLIDKFWPNRSGDPTHTLHNAISRLRKETAGLIKISSDAQGYQLVAL